MNSFDTKPFEIEHLDHLKLREFDHGNISKADIETVSKSSEMFTIFVDDEVTALVGYMKKWEGVYEVFVFPGEQTNKYPVLYVYKIRRFLNLITRDFGMRRIQTISPANEESDRWMRALGFVCEGTLVGYTAGGVDCRQWARLRKVSQ